MADSMRMASVRVPLNVCHFGLGALLHLSNELLVAARLAGAAGAVAALRLDPFEEEVHQFTGAQFPALAVLLGVQYTSKVLAEELLGVREGNFLDVAEAGIAASFGEPVDEFPDLLLAELGVSRPGPSPAERGKRKGLDSRDHYDNMT
jgi:hypothetical protein